MSSQDLPNLEQAKIHLARHYHFCMTFDLEKESLICYAFWVPHEVYIKDFSKFHCFSLVLSSWCLPPSSGDGNFFVELPPCHISKVVSWHVHWWYKLHLWSSQSKIWLKVSKSGKYWQYYREHKISQNQRKTIEFWKSVIQCQS